MFVFNPTQMSCLTTMLAANANQKILLLAQGILREFQPPDRGRELVVLQLRQEAGESPGSGEYSRGRKGEGRSQDNLVVCQD